MSQEYNTGFTNFLKLFCCFFQHFLQKIEHFEILLTFDDLSLVLKFLEEPWWVKALQYESKGSRFKTHQALGWAQGTNLATRLPVTFGSNMHKKRAVINIGLVRLSPREWPKVGSGAAKQQLKIYIYIYEPLASF